MKTGLSARLNPPRYLTNDALKAILKLIDRAKKLNSSSTDLRPSCITARGGRDTPASCAGASRSALDRCY
jgi:hypothetical protein